MKLSNYLLPILKDNPIEAQIVSHRLMLRAGLIRQLASGIYEWLPLGLQVLRNVENIIRDTMNEAGALEVLLPSIQPVTVWEQSGRYGQDNDLCEQMLQMQDRHGNSFIFAPTAEEVITLLFKQNVQSYKQLPCNLYQISWKFRDEIRPRFGVMRGREFLMKDGYSFDLDKESALISYKNMLHAYLKAYKRLGLTAIPVAADTGAIGGEYSHEFHVLAETGESKIFYEQGVEEIINSPEFSLEKLNSFYAMEEERHNPENCPVSNDKLLSKRGIEVGHIFFLGDKYTKQLDVKVQAPDGKLVNPIMGTYGIGVSRLVGAIIEANHDDKGIIWPANVAPFKVVIINLRPQDDKCSAACLELYNEFQNNGVSVLLDDTNDSAGAKFAKMDLIGIPMQIIIGPNELKNNQCEIRYRKNGLKEIVPLNAETLKKYIY
jgi:prolyl-tRNA synthetase